MDVRTLAIGAVIGSVIAVCAPVSVQPAMGLLAALVLVALLPGRPRAWSLVALAGITAGWLYTHIAISQRLADRWVVSDTPVAVSGTVIGLPDNTRDGDADPQPDRTRFRLQTDSGERLWLSWYRPPQAVHAGQCWQLRVRLRDLRGLANQGGFDYEAWLLREGFVARGTVVAGDACGHRAGLDPWRDSAGRRIVTGLGAGPGSALLRALTLGDRRGFTDADWSVLRATGTSHLVAISGLHVGLVATIGFVLGGWLWRRSAWLCARLPAPRAAAVVSVLLAAAYAAAAGFALPTQRALIMVVVVATCLAAPVRVPGFVALAIAALAVLLRDPLATLSPGFWLSFGAVALILWMMAGRAVAGVGWRRLLGLQLGLSVGLAPLAVYFFGQTSVAGLLVNLVLVPAFAVLTPLVLLLTGGALAWPELIAPLAALLADVLAEGWMVLETIASWPGAAWVASAGPVATTLAGLGALWVLSPLPWAWRSQGLVLWLPLLASRPVMPAQGAWVDVLDVGQGLSVVVRTAEHVLVYDTGPAYRSGFNTAEAVVLPMLGLARVPQLDALLISHGDNDHAGGANQLAAAMSPRRRIGMDGAPCEAGQHWQWDGVEFAILHPTPGDGYTGNNASCVLRVSIDGGGSVLIPGDIEARVERSLLAQQRGVASDVLVLPHHGSASSSTDAFLDAVDSDVAIAPAGWDNRWDFPRPVVRQRLAARDTPLWITGRDGQIRVIVPTDGPARVAWAYRDHAPRRWRMPAGPHPAAQK